MDWTLGISTLAANFYLGYAKSKSLGWGVHAVNSLAWVYWGMSSGLHGMAFLGIATCMLDCYGYYLVNK